MPVAEPESVYSGSPYRSNIRVLNPRMLSGPEIRRLQAANGVTPCFGTDERHGCKHRDCPFARRCLGGLVAHWKR